MTPPTMTPDELTARREALGMSPAQLARALQVAEATISRWESGKNAIRMAGVLDLALQTLEREHEEREEREASDSPLQRLPRTKGPRQYTKVDW